uniref:Uncharacterized protein n=1 Tax=Coccidioides posadasii RMSCC 3488 TaxID=454284 RepID=A0A0J6FEA3_COCPO|nr:hypothetical protein CPAG_04944 [Coccidioides posadasii RMSCC 3488]
MAGSVQAKQFHLSELSIIRNVHSSDSSKIFLVKYEGAKYCLKVDIDPLMPTLTPYLNAFLGDLHHPCAILLESIFPMRSL